MIPALASTDINARTAILVIRVWAVYERRRSILIFLLLCWVASYGTSIAIAALRVKVGSSSVTRTMYQTIYYPFVSDIEAAPVSWQADTVISREIYYLTAD